MKKLFIAPSIAIVFMFTSCAHKLVGTWNIDRYETTAPGRTGVALSNIGTMTFKRNGSGEKNVRYSVFGNHKIDDSPFGWHATGPYVGIESSNSDFSKTWIITTNKRKTQKWKSTDGANGVQILELSK